MMQILGGRKAFRPTVIRNIPSINFVNRTSQWRKFSLGQLQSELVEEYQDYLDHRDVRLAWKETFRCTPPWFGPRCQYLLNLPDANTLEHRFGYYLTLRLLMKQPDYMRRHNCYTLLHCQRDGLPVCLHWSQICDGKIDCIDGEEDEENCFAMEMNECKSNEYRCHNGQCVPNNIDDSILLPCLDSSNIIHELDGITFEDEIAAVFFEGPHVSTGQ